MLEYSCAEIASKLATGINRATHKGRTGIDSKLGTGIKGAKPL